MKLGEEWIAALHLLGYRPPWHGVLKSEDRTLKRRKNVLFYALVALGAFAVFVMLHLSQQSWAAMKCDQALNLGKTLPRSCEQMALRLWVVPVVAALTFALVGFLRMHTGSFKGSWRYLVMSFSLVTGARFTSPVARAISSAVAATCAAALLLWHLFERHGVAILRPQNTGWLSGGGDTAQAYLGSLFLRQPLADGSAVASLPLGRLDHIMAPYGTNIGFMDPVFLLSYLLRFFPSVVGPTDQFFGLWIAFCFVSFALFAALCAQRLFVAWVPQVLAGCVLALFAPLLFRLEWGHFTLAFMMVVPLSCLLLLKIPDVEGLGGNLAARPTHVHLIFLVMFAVVAWLHPYLTLLIAVPYAAYFLTQMPLCWQSVRATALWLGVVGFLSVVPWWLIGYIGSGIPAAEKESPSWFTANVNTFANSFGWSTFLKQLDTATGGQYEGFGYLGLGVLLFLFYHFARHGLQSVVVFWREQKALAAAALIGVTLATGTLLSVFSIKVELPIPVYSSLLAPFRSVGRFIWIPAFVMTLVAMYPLVRRSPVRQTIALALLLGIQVWDLAPFRRPARSGSNASGQSTEFVPTGLSREPALLASESDQWLKVLGGSRAIVAYPPLMHTVEIRNDYELFWWLSLRTGASVNVGYVSRFDASLLEPAAERLRTDLSRGQFASQTVYVVGKSNEHLIAGSARRHCREIGRYFACKGGMASP